MIELSRHERATTSRTEFDKARLGQISFALIDLTDPLRTNVKCFVNGNAMFTDITTLRNLSDSGNDTSGVAATIVKAWERALNGELRGSNLITFVPPGIIQVRLMDGFTPPTSTIN